MMRLTKEVCKRKNKPNNNGTVDCYFIVVIVKRYKRMLLSHLL